MGCYLFWQILREVLHFFLAFESQTHASEKLNGHIREVQRLVKQLKVVLHVYCDILFSIYLKLHHF